MEQGDPGGTGYAPDASPPTDGIRVRWKQPLDTTDGYGAFPPIVANGLVYSVGRELLCVTAADGTVVFRANHSTGPLALATARAYNTLTLVYPTWDGAIGLNAGGGISGGGIRTGLSRWKTSRRRGGVSIPTGIGSRELPAPVAANDTVFLADPGTGTGLMAIDASTGQIRWYRPDGQRYPALGGRPAVRDETVYAVGLAESGYDYIFGYDTETGKQTFSFSPKDVLFSVTAAPDYLVVGTDGSGLWAVNYDETRRWTYDPQELLLTHPASVAVADGVVYAGFVWGGRNWLVALDGEKGTEQWRSELSRGVIEPRVGLPAVANGVIYVPTGGDQNETQGLVAVDATDGHIRWRFSPGDRFLSISPAALVGETLYTVGNGHLYALEEQ